jgi:DNA-binding GntR family transcriptional regulator
VTFSPESVVLDRTSPIPLYFQVAQHLERAIESGEIEAGSRLDNEVDLADRLGLSRPTMRRAIQYLVDRGYLVRKRGVGTQVVHPKVRRPLQLTSLYDDLSTDGKLPTTKVLRLEEVAAPDTVARSLNLAEGAAVIDVQRLRYAQGEPLAVLRNYLPKGLVDLDARRLEVTGLYQLMRAAGVRLHLASQSIGARMATASEAKLLDDAKAAPLLTMTRIAYNDSGTPVEYGNHIYRASHYSFELVLVDR